MLRHQIRPRSCENYTSQHAVQLAAGRGGRPGVTVWEALLSCSCSSCALCQTIRQGLSKLEEDWILPEVRTQLHSQTPRHIAICQLRERHISPQHSHELPFAHSACIQWLACPHWLTLAHSQKHTPILRPGHAHLQAPPPPLQPPLV